MAAVDAVRLASARLQVSSAVAVPKSSQPLFSILPGCHAPCQGKVSASSTRASGLMFFLDTNFEVYLVTSDTGRAKKISKCER